MRDMEDTPGARGHDHEPAAAELPVPREDAGSVASDDDSDSDGEFEFPSVSRESAAGGSFSGGRVRAFYPVFGRVLDDAAAAAPAPRAALGQLFQLEQARASSVASTSSSSSSADAGLDGAPPESYCLWTPGSSSSAASSPSRPPRKSGSTGSIARWRRIGELVVGRSQSDGKEKFLFLSAPPSPSRDSTERSPAASKSKAKPPPKGSKTAAAAAATELDTVAAGRRMSYGGPKASAGGRRTFLPYRQDLVGLFANVQGLRRSQNPF